VVWSVRLDSEAAAAALARTPHQGRDLADFAAAPDAASRLLRRRLTRALLAHLDGVASEAILFGRTSEGAPSVLSPPGWHMSVAGRWPNVLVGFAEVPLGVDVEPLDDAPPLWDMLTSAEAAAVESLPVGERPAEWLRRWAAKEAHAKRLGFARRAEPVAVATAPRPFGFDVTSAQGGSRVFVRDASRRVEAVALPV